MLSDVLLEKYGRFEPSERKKIMKCFYTVEDLLQADEAALKKTGVNVFFLQACQSALGEVMEDCGGYVES